MQTDVTELNVEMSLVTPMKLSNPDVLSNN
jgi:hypothetical protein